MKNNSEGKDRLKGLRQQRKLVVERVSALVKEQNRVRREINKALKEGSRTVPAVAAAIGIPSSTVFWHLIAMKKYGRVVEAGQEDNYPTYRLTEA